MGNRFKKEIGMICEFSPSGAAKPLFIKWEDGRKFSIDHILDMRKAASLKAGGSGIRYICMVHGKEVTMFKDGDCWWLELDG